ncbi:MAG: dihydrofolate reductase, partial [Bacilli bacterium]|nr:dihydrofolate reductase [Bacilli bacterium]
MISMIFAMDKNNLIGKGNSLPWHYSLDLKYFKETTLNHTVIMGENTFYSLGKPLPNRKNVVATLNPDFKADGVTVIHDLIKFLKENIDTEEELFVIGGAQIYKLSMLYAKRLYITHIDRAHEGDL